MAKKKQEEQEEESEGMSLDDAFGDDEDVEYAESKPRKVKKKKDEDEEDFEVEKGAKVDLDVEQIKLKGSKPISELKKGDKIKVDCVEMEVDAHYVLIDHGANKEMTIEMFDSVKDEDFQLRYFDDRVAESAEFFELEEIVYQRKNVKEISW